MGLKECKTKIITTKNSKHIISFPNYNWGKKRYISKEIRKLLHDIVCLKINKIKNIH